MGMFRAMDVASTGLSAQRLRMDVIANNIANAGTTRTTDGEGPYLRKRVVMIPRNIRTRWRSPIQPYGMRTGQGEGVRVLKVDTDKEGTRLVYDPSHPDSIQIGPKKGYVEYPNVNMVREMTDMISATRSYEANVQIINGSKMMFNKALEIGR